MAEEHPLAKLISRLRERDKNAVDDMQMVGASIENRLTLADGRAVDALLAVCEIAKYLMEREK